MAASLDSFGLLGKLVSQRENVWSISCRLILVRSDLLTAAKNPSRRFRLSFSRSLPLLVITFGIPKKETSLSLPERLERPKTIQSTMNPCAELYTTTRNHVTTKTVYNSYPYDISKSPHSCSIHLEMAVKSQVLSKNSPNLRLYISQTEKHVRGKTHTTLKFYISST